MSFSTTSSVRPQNEQLATSLEVNDFLLNLNLQGEWIKHKAALKNLIVLCKLAQILRTPTEQ